MSNIQDLLKKFGIEHGFENDQANIDGFVKELEAEIKERERIAFNRGLIWATEYLINKNNGNE